MLRCSVCISGVSLRSMVCVCVCMTCRWYVTVWEFRIFRYRMPGFRFQMSSLGALFEQLFVDP